MARDERDDPHAVRLVLALLPGRAERLTMRALAVAGGALVVLGLGLGLAAALDAAGERAEARLPTAAAVRFADRASVMPAAAVRAASRIRRVMRRAERALDEELASQGQLDDALHLLDPYAGRGMLEASAGCLEGVAVPGEVLCRLGEHTFSGTRAAALLEAAGALPPAWRERYVRTRQLAALEENEYGEVALRMRRAAERSGEGLMGPAASEALWQWASEAAGVRPVARPAPSAAEVGAGEATGAPRGGLVAAAAVTADGGWSWSLALAAACLVLGALVGGLALLSYSRRRFVRVTVHPHGLRVGTSWVAAADVVGCRLEGPAGRTIRVLRLGGQELVLGPFDGAVRELERLVGLVEGIALTPEARIVESRARLELEASHRTLMERLRARDAKGVEEAGQRADGRGRGRPR